MSIIRLHVTTEGQTEQAFVKKLLAPHLADFNIFVDGRCVLTSKDKKAAKEYRGGLVNYPKARADIIDWMKEDGATECRFTTMFDLYALPDDFPGYAEAQKVDDPYAKIKALEQVFADDIDDRRFLPYIQLHEFETLILAEPQKLDWEYLEHKIPIRKLLTMVGKKNPELINDGPTTAPSRRILAEIPEYDKVTAGVEVVSQIGLATLRVKCSHFNDWLTSLEGLGTGT